MSLSPARSTPHRKSFPRSFNAISSLGYGLNCCVHLRSLSLAHNKITKIDPSTLVGLQHLLRLDLSSNFLPPNKFCVLDPIAEAVGGTLVDLNLADQQLTEPRPAGAGALDGITSTDHHEGDDYTNGHAWREQAVRLFPRLNVYNLEWVGGWGPAGGSKTEAELSNTASEMIWPDGRDEGEEGGTAPPKGRSSSVEGMGCI